MEIAGGKADVTSYADLGKGSLIEGLGEKQLSETNNFGFMPGRGMQFLRCGNL